MPDTEILPEPVPGESKEAFEALYSYFMMRDRSYSAVARQLGKRTSVIEGWAAKYRWNERFQDPKDPNAEEEEYEAPERILPERIEGESAEAHEALCEYCETPPNERSLRAVAKQLGKSLSLIERWSAKHQWVERVRKPDESRSARRNKKQSAERIAMKKRQLLRCHAASATAMIVVRRISKRKSEVLDRISKMPVERLQRLTSKAQRALIHLHEAERNLASEILAFPEHEPGMTDDGGPHFSLNLGCECGARHSLIDAEQWPCESARAYVAFRKYCEMGMKRSVRGAAAELKRHPSQIQGWAKRFKWADRALIDDRTRRIQIESPEFQEERQMLRRQLMELPIACEVVGELLEASHKRMEELCDKMDIIELMKVAMRDARQLPAIHRDELEGRVLFAGGSIVDTFLETVVTFPADAPDYGPLNRALRGDPPWGPEKTPEPATG